MRLIAVEVDGNPAFQDLDSGKCFRALPQYHAPDLENPLTHKEPAKSLPLVNPTKIVCVGRNYAAHAAELGNDVPKKPLLFLKAPSSLVFDNDPILIPPQSSRVEHEAEIGIVIGREMKMVSGDENPLDYVLGFTCLNDVTARDIQKSDVQFTRGKSFDTFCPVGPWIKTDLETSNLDIELTVNGDLRQNGNTSQMIFDIPYLLRYISDHMTLFPGDLIATGTPAGVSPLAPGDVCEIKIKGLGTLTNTVRDLL